MLELNMGKAEKIFRVTLALHCSRRGSTTVLALMVSLLLMVLVMSTMMMTMVDTETVQDYARNKKTLQAADSGIAHAKTTMAHALSSFSLPPATKPEDVTGYANDADSEDRAGDRDISLLVDAGAHVDEVLPRNDTSTSGMTEYVSGGLFVGYDAAVDIYPVDVQRPAAGDISHKHIFSYEYQISSEGDADINQQHNQATRVERGNFEVDVERPSFATYGYFTQSMKNQFNQQLWFYEGEVYDGPTHVNSAPPEGRAGFWGQATFNGPFTAVQARYEDSALGGNANPLFNDSVTWGVDPIELPPNGWSQARAALGDYANVDNTAPLSDTELRELLGLPANGLPVDKGVYYSENYNEDGGLLGGLYVAGSPDEVKLTVSGSEQVITIKMNNVLAGEFQGNNTWELHSNSAAGTSWVKYTDNSGAVTTRSFSDKFNGLIHVEGNVKSLKGNGSESLPDIEESQELTVSATGNIFINDHITYEDSPVNNPDAENIFGLFSSNGNIYLGRNAPSNVRLHATVMATSPNHGVGAEGITIGGGYDYNYPNKGNWKLLGGLIENKNQTTGVFYSDGHLTGYRWDFTYDERFQSGKAPPFFPYVTRFVVTRREIRSESWGRKYY